MQNERSEIISAVSRLDLKSYDVVEMNKWVMKARRNKERLEREKEKRTIEEAKRGLLPPAKPHPRPLLPAEEAPRNAPHQDDVRTHDGSRLDRPPTYDEGTYDEGTDDEGTDDEGPAPPYEEPLKITNRIVSDSRVSDSRMLNSRRPKRRPSRSCILM